MAGIIGVGSLTSPKRRDRRDKHLVSNEEIHDRACQELPLPPPGSRWEQDEDGAWSMVEVEPAGREEAAREGGDTPREPRPAARREHVILPGDTLQGICLKYGLSPRALKRANPGLDTRDSQLRGVFAVVLPGDGPVQPRSIDVDIARFRAAVPSLGSQEARFYLLCASDVDDAVRRARADLAWEAAVAPPPKKAPEEADVVSIEATMAAEPVAVPVARAQRVERDARGGDATTVAVPVVTAESDLPPVVTATAVTGNDPEPEYETWTMRYLGQISDLF